MCVPGAPGAAGGSPLVGGGAPTRAPWDGRNTAHPSPGPPSAPPGAQPCGSSSAWLTSQCVDLAATGAWPPWDGRRPSARGASWLSTPRCAARQPAGSGTTSWGHTPAAAPCRGCNAAAFASRRAQCQRRRAAVRNRCSPSDTSPTPLRRPSLCNGAAPTSSGSDLVAPPVAGQALRTCETSGRKSTAKS